MLFCFAADGVETGQKNIRLLFANSPKMAAGGDDAAENGEEGDSGGGVEVLEDEGRPNLKEPAKYAVMLLNDDYTTMDFVVDVLQRFFRKSQQEATQIMLRVHQEGKGLAGVYVFEIAETKVAQVHEYARAHGFPLRCGLEPLL